MQIRIWDLFFDLDTESGMEKFGSRIWYINPGSATLLHTLTSTRSGVAYLGYGVDK